MRDLSTPVFVTDRSFCHSCDKKCGLLGTSVVDLPRSCDKNWGIRRLSSLRYRFLPCCTGIASIPTKCTSCTARGLHTYNGTTSSSFTYWRSARSTLRNLQ